LPNQGLLAPGFAAAAALSRWASNSVSASKSVSKSMSSSLTAVGRWSSVVTFGAAKPA